MSVEALQPLFVAVSLSKRPYTKVISSSFSSFMQRTVVVRAQCRAVDALSETSSEPARQCDQITRRGFYCAAHANELLGLEVKTSLLLGEPGAAGLGLFTTRDRVA